MDAATAYKSVGHRGAMAYAPENTLESFSRGAPPWRDRGRDRRQADVRRRADRDARRFAEADHGCRPAGGRNAGGRAAGVGADLRAGHRLLPASWGWAATSRSSPAKAARRKPRALPSPPSRRPLAGQPARAAARELQGRLAGGSPRSCAGICARALLIDELKDDWRGTRRRVEAVGINTSGKRLTAPPCRRDQAGRLPAQHLHGQRP